MPARAAVRRLGTVWQRGQPMERDWDYMWHSLV